MFDPRHSFTKIRRSTAILGVALVMLLNILTVSPRLHAWIHGQSGAERGEVAVAKAKPAAVSGQSHQHRGTNPAGELDHECAVTLFAGGVAPLLFFCLLLLARPWVRPLVLRATDWIAVAQPRYWHVPSHAPPRV